MVPSHIRVHLPIALTYMHTYKRKNREVQMSIYIHMIIYAYIPYYMFLKKICLKCGDQASPAPTPSLRHRMRVEVLYIRLQ